MRIERSKYPGPWRITEYVDVAARARELGCAAPEGVALLPGNFATAASRAEFRYHEVIPQVREAWRGAGLLDTGPGRKRQPAGYATTPGETDRALPIAVFFGARLPAAHTRPVLSALGMIASILTTDPVFARAREVRVDAIVEHPLSGGCVCLEYHGDACELVSLARTVHEVRGDAPDVGSTICQAGAVS